MFLRQPLKLRGPSTEARLLALDEDNDPDDLIGRPNGYVAATAPFDSRVSWAGDEPGLDCGATIEQWPAAKAAQERANYSDFALT